MPTALDSCSRERSLGCSTEKPTRSNERCPTISDRTDLPDDEVAQYGPILLARTRLWLGDLNGAREICEQTLDPLAAPNLQQVALTGALAWVACVEGLLTEADHLAEQALTGAESVGLAAHTAMVDAVRTQGRVAFERGDLVTAERVLEQSLSISEDCRPAFALVSQLSLSRVWLADGRVGEALSGVERARAFLRPDSTSPLLGLCHALEGRIAIEIGDLDRATRCAQSLQPGNRASLLQARIELARSEPDRADDALARCTPATMRERLDVALLSARVAHVRKSDAADPLLAEALAVAKIEGFVVAVTDDLVELRPRVAAASPVRTHREIRAGRARSPRTRPDRPNANGSTSGPLSSRELTVVRYLASRLTNKEIAAELFVSNNTLKTHIKRIYQKLGVSSRIEAVSRSTSPGPLLTSAPKRSRARTNTKRGLNNKEEVGTARADRAGIRRSPSVPWRAPGEIGEMKPQSSAPGLDFAARSAAWRRH